MHKNSAFLCYDCNFLVFVIVLATTQSINVFAKLRIKALSCLQTTNFRLYLAGIEFKAWHTRLKFLEY